MRSFVFGCLFAVVGMPLGVFAGLYFGRCESTRFYERSGRHPCGLIYLPYLFFGPLLGGMAFGTAGAIAGSFAKRRRGTAQHRNDRDATRAIPHLRQIADDPNPYAPPKSPEAAAFVADRRVSKGAIAAVWLCVLITIVTVMFLPVRLPTLKFLIFCALALIPLLLVKLVLAAAYPSGDLDQR